MSLMAEEPVPTRQLITARSEYQQAIDMLLPMVQRELRVFDPDLSDLRLHVPERIALLRAFLGRSRNNRLYIAVHKTEFIEQRAPRRIRQRFEDLIHGGDNRQPKGCVSTPSSDAAFSPVVAVAQGC